MLVKLINRENPKLIKIIRDVVDLDSSMDTEGNLCLYVKTRIGWRGLYPLIFWYAEIQQEEVDPYGTQIS